MSSHDRDPIRCRHVPRSLDSLCGVILPVDRVRANVCDLEKGAMGSLHTLHFVRTLFDGNSVRERL